MAPVAAQSARQSSACQRKGVRVRQSREVGSRAGRLIGQWLLIKREFARLQDRDRRPAPSIQQATI
jgi:hypothetical protein